MDEAERRALNELGSSNSNNSNNSNNSRQDDDDRKIYTTTVTLNMIGWSLDLTRDVVTDRETHVTIFFF